jgi:ribosomal protein S18 acetylase RimI-like enzyme
MSAVNDAAYAFYRRLGFEELARQGEGVDGSIYLGKRLTPS